MMVTGAVDIQMVETLSACARGPRCSPGFEDHRRGTRRAEETSVSSWHSRRDRLLPALNSRRRYTSRLKRPYGLALLLLVAAPGFLHAGQTFDPPPPDPPDVIRRSPEGKATIRATRVHEPLKIDGKLDEPVYDQVRFLTDFVQSIPDNGRPATQRTEAWVLFDENYLYVSARCYDTRQESQWMANEMRRDNSTPQDDFGIGLDTFFDKRNGYQFYTNALGRRSEQQITNEGGQVNFDYNPVWEVRSGRFEGGWTVEMAIPFKSLRYRPGTSQVWGMQIRRTIRSRNEWSWLTPLPISVKTGGNLRQSTFPTLVDLQVPAGSRNLEIKPYVTSSVVTDRLALQPYSNDPSGDVGLDVKYGITQNLTADITVNTDVAQVEADDQQVNLTRFNISFPEKREFFLEGQNLFNLASVGSDMPTLFYSRNIGLQGGRVAPMIAGVRMTGKVGRTSVGALNVQTGEEAVSGARGTNFTVLRLKQDVLRRSSVGVLFTNRSSSLVRPGQASPAIGLDSSFAFYQNVYLSALYSKSNAPGVSGPSNTYGGQFKYDHDRHGLTVGHLFVAKGFKPEVGFVARDDLRQTFASARISPRPASVPHVLQFSWTGGLTYTANAANVLTTRVLDSQFITTFKNTQSAMVTLDRTFDRLERPFQIVPTVAIPPGSYDFTTFRASYTLAESKRVSGTFSAAAGSFYAGSDRSAGYTGRFVLTPRLALEPSVSLRWTDLPGGSFTTQQYRTRVTYTVTPLIFWSGLLQYNTNSHILSTNLRLRWEYSAGSELFLAYSEEEDGHPANGRFASLRNRTLAFKMNRLLRF